MNTPPVENDPLAPLIDTLRANRRPRVWSLIVTVFGDLALPRGGELPLHRLQVLLGRIGVEAGTIRTALSRLGRDGWVERRRTGRASFYHLSARAEAETRDATAQIYAAPAENRDWALHLGDRPGGDALQIGPMAWLAPQPTPSDAASVFLRGQIMQPFPTGTLAPDHREALEFLTRDLSALPPVKAVALTPLEAAAARVLLIHRWRRFALRYPQILPGADPRAGVARAYEALFEASELWCDSVWEGMPALPPRSEDIRQRFHP